MERELPSATASVSPPRSAANLLEVARAKQGDAVGRLQQKNVTPPVNDRHEDKSSLDYMSNISLCARFAKTIHSRRNLQGRQLVISILVARYPTGVVFRQSYGVRLSSYFLDTWKWNIAMRAPSGGSFSLPTGVIRAKRNKNKEK